MRRLYLFPLAAAIMVTASLINCSSTSTADEKKQNEITSSEVTNNPVKQEDANKTTAVTGSEVIYLNTETFKKEVFDYTKNKEWKYNGKIPAIVDFYADWCRPCKMLEPTLVELQKEYKGKIQIYKVNTDNNPELSQAFAITGIPALLFIPMEGEPQMSTGLLPKENLETAINDVLKVTK